MARRLPFRFVAILFLETSGLGGRLYAFDVATGKVLWHLETGQSAGGGIVTYRARGRQLLAMATGMKSPIWPGGADASRIFVYGLPGR